MSKLRIPAPSLPPEPTVFPKGKCRTCAYHAKPMREELEMAVFYYRERPHPHRCHERNGVYCHGAAEVVAAIEQTVMGKLITKVM